VTNAQAIGTPMSRAIPGMVAAALAVAAPARRHEVGRPARTDGTHRTVAGAAAEVTSDT